MSRLKETPSIQNVLDVLMRVYADAKCSLNYEDPFQLLAATILSAQCTDERVNKVTPNLFEKYPDAKKLAAAKQKDVEKIIASTGFFRNKAKSLIGMSRNVAEKYNGVIPQTMEELVHLPGVGRKTANVVLGNAFGKPAGVVVDTHVKRLSFRLGLSKQTDPTKVEQDLNKIIPEKYWTELPHWLIQHGRQICKARKPDCVSCPLLKLCPRKGFAKA